MHVCRSLHDIARHELEEELAEVHVLRCVLNDALRRIGVLFEQTLRQLRIDAGARLQQVHGAKADENCYRRNHDGYEQCLPTDAAERCEIAHLRNANDYGAKEQWQHQHKQQAEEDLPDRPGDVGDDPIDLRGLAHHNVGIRHMRRDDRLIDVDPDAQADRKADQHQKPKGNAAALGRVHSGTSLPRSLTVGGGESNRKRREASRPPASQHRDTHPRQSVPAARLPSCCAVPPTRAHHTQHSASSPSRAALAL